MRLTIPVFVEEVASGEASSTHCARPLFRGFPEAEHERIQRALTWLAAKLGKELAGLGKAMRHEELAERSFCPDFRDQRLDVTLELRSRTVRCRFLVVSFDALGARLAFTPGLPDLWFMVEKGQDIRERATEVLTRHFRELEKDEGRDVLPEEAAIQGTTWVTTVDVDVHPPQVAVPPRKLLFALLGGEEAPDGAVELESVGLCLDSLYPDELEGAFLREDEVSELARVLGDESDRRPVVLVGPRGVGKTAIVHEYVRRTAAGKDAGRRKRSKTWLLWPQRLISGMSYVGQWENRLLAILDEARRRRHVLYFDDLLGLYHAGKSSGSSLCVAHVLKPYVERRDVRLLAEMTHEALSALREVDRGFADLFHVVPVREPGEEAVLRILIRVMRRLEDRHRCRFDLAVLPAVLDLQRRYARDVAFPGKAASFLTQLAVKYRNAACTRDQVLEEFHAKSGMAVSFLDGREKLERNDVLSELRKEVIGQDAALGAMADVVSVAKARLNDPQRPLASFLFLGPTGVGKTQCAKTLAGYLFGSGERLLRFDMNEYVDPSSAARLAGTFDEPEGLLTSAVRRQPFSVILLDEIEKAHPDVFDLLLQVTGEGRLTDALGRTADFTNSIVIMTSNLGVREAAGRPGFRADESRDDSVYTEAAERFFRPEFFNRLDRVVPFARLGREDMGRIARLLIRRVFERGGLARRKCVLQIDRKAMETIVSEGYHPQLGARALKRAIERRIAQPVGSRLATMTPDAPAVVGFLPGKEGVKVRVQGLETARPEARSVASVDLSDPGAVLGRLESCLARIGSSVSRFRPDGPVEAGKVRPQQQHYFAVQDRLGGIRLGARRLADRVAAAKRHALRGPAGFRGSSGGRRLHREGSRRRALLGWCYRERNIWKEIHAAQDVRQFLAELAESSAPAEDETRRDLVRLLRDTALLSAIAEAKVEGPVERVLLYLRASHEGNPILERLQRAYAELFGGHFGLDVSVPEGAGDLLSGDERLLLAEGPASSRLARVEEGTQFCYLAGGELGLIQVLPLPAAPGEDAPRAARALLARREEWLAKLSEGAASPQEDPFAFGPVIRIFEEGKTVVDLRSGLVETAGLSVGGLRAFVLSQLPLPDEMLG